MPDMPKGTERPEVNQTTGAIDQTSEQHPFTAAERISKALRKRKQRNQIRRMAGKYLGTAIMVTALILAVVVVYRNWDFFKPESFKETVTIRSDSKSLMKIGGAMDVITGNTAQYMSFASGLAVVTTPNIRYATEAGDAGFLADLTLNQPAAAASGSHLVVYDRGGKTVASADESGILAKAEALGNCISADVNRNGWIAIVSECEGYQCAAAVYDQQMNRRYVWKTPAYFAAGAIASENGNYMAVLTVSIEERQLSAKVLVFHLQKEGVAAEIDLGTARVLDVMENDVGLLIVTDTEAITASWSGAVTGRVSFQGDQVCGMEKDGHAIFLLLTAENDATVRYRLTRLDETGTQTARIHLKCDVQAISAGNGMLALLTGSQIRLYDETLAVTKYVSPEPGITNIVMMRNNKLVMITAQELFIA